MTLTIRAVRPDEHDVAGELVVEAYRTLADETGVAYEALLRDVSGRVADSEVLVAELDGRIVGTVTFVDGQRTLSEVDDPGAATIRMLGVATEARGRGIGRALVVECIDRARRSDRERVRIHTRTSMTTAHALYASLGFRRDPEHDRSPSPGIRLLAYVLELQSSEPKSMPS